MKLDKIIVGQNAFTNKDPSVLIESNISVVNLLRNHGVSLEKMHPVSAGSYFLDYYIAQCNNGGFAQFVWNSKWNKFITDSIYNSLKEIGSVEHLDYFLQRRKKVNAGVSGLALKTFLNSSLFDDSDIKQKLQDDSFYEIKENLIQLNSNWIKQHKDLHIAQSKEEMFLLLEEYIGSPIER